MGLRYNESVDTFSFSLVLLSLAVGDVDHVRKCTKTIRFSDTTYQSGWRPAVPAKLAAGRPALIKLIQSMWHRDLDQRPRMQDVKEALSTMAGPPLELSKPPLRRANTLAV